MRLVRQGLCTPLPYALRASDGLRRTKSIRARCRPKPWRKVAAEAKVFYVYLLQSESDISQRYIGYTTDLKQRIPDHNSGKSKHTVKYMPWNLVSYHAFASKQKAQEFEHYSKTGSGQAFASKRFW